MLVKDPLLPSAQWPLGVWICYKPFIHSQVEESFVPKNTDICAKSFKFKAAASSDALVSLKSLIP